ncbi:MAG TPA: hypothetical protein VMW91_07140 [Desulfosporosinus sp.]|nr:hypothetical protein [Desulfosporosinus sp.]
MASIQISKDPPGQIVVTFPYDPLFLAKIKPIPGHRWHPAKKYWTSPNTDVTLERIIKAFEKDRVTVGPVIKTHKPISEELASDSKGGKN